MCGFAYGFAVVEVRVPFEGSRVVVKWAQSGAATQTASSPLLGKQRPQLFDYDEDQTETTNDTRPRSSRATITIDL